MQSYCDHRGICVIGSLNVDLSVSLPRFHNPGETITGDDFRPYPGGKGGNQAVAAARLGADVRFIGKLGDDDNGAFYRRVFRTEHVDDSCVRSLQGIPTGVALIEVDANGENRIVVVPGANGLVEPSFVSAMLRHVPDDFIYMLQLEIPLDTVQRAAEVISQKGGTLLLDPAPAVPLNDDLLRLTHLLTPNQHELRLLTGMPADTPEEAEIAARLLLARGVKAVVAKLGSRGCLYVDEQITLEAAGFPVNAVDTTGAGDAFNAGLAAALSRGLSMPRALRVANATGALSVTATGAQAGMPNWEHVQLFLQEQENA